MNYSSDEIDGMSDRQKLRKLISKTSPWRKEAEWRQSNEEWLSASFDIAVRVLESRRLERITHKA